MALQRVTRRLSLGSTTLLLFILVICVTDQSTYLADATMFGPHTSNETLIGKYINVSFPRVPNILLNFKDANGFVIPDTNETFAWISLNEVDNSTGSAVAGGQPLIVSSLDVQDPNLIWQETVLYLVDSNGNPYKNVNYSATFTNGVTFTLAHYYFSQSYRIDYPYLNTTRDLPPDSFKLSFSISGWVPQDPSNLILIRLDDSAYPFYRNVFRSLDGYLYQIMADIGDRGITQYLNLLDTAVVDDVPARLRWYGEDGPNVTFVPELRFTGFKLYFYFPVPTASFFYDPDLSVLVADQGTDGDGSDDTQTILIAVLVPVLAGGALFMVIVVAVLAVAFWVVKSLVRNAKLRRLDKIDLSTTVTTKST